MTNGRIPSIGARLALALSIVFASCAGASERGPTSAGGTRSAHPQNASPGSPEASSSKAGEGLATTPGATTPGGPTPGGDASGAFGKAGHPWCNQSYSTTPCVFRVYGDCWLRRCTQPSCDEGGFSHWYCPPGDPPAFMGKGMPCGRRASEPVLPQRARYSTRPECNDLETLWANVPHEDRQCRADSDCSVVRGNCFGALLNAKAASRPDMQRPPCGSPMAGACPPNETKAVCANGCCIDVGGGFGTVPAVYPRISPP